MNQDDAIAKARLSNQKSALGLKTNTTMFSAAYQADTLISDYLSYNDRTKKTLNQAIKSKKIQPSYWAVRIYAPNEVQESYYYFTSSGQPYGFEIQLPQEKILPNMTKEKAIELAEKELRTYPLEGMHPPHFHIKDYAQETLDKRTNHTVIFEDTSQSLIEAKRQIMITISGDQVTTIKPKIKLPENFLREFANMYTFNSTLSSYGNLFIYLGYGALALYALFTGSKKNQINWRDSGIASAIITLFLLLNNINNLPLSWYSAYKTTQTPSTFLCITMITFISMATVNFIGTALSFSAAEYLSRLTFPKHLQLWHWWKKESASSPQTIYLVFIGYIIFGLSTGYIAIFYILVQFLPQVWLPAGAMIDPNIIALYQPFFNPLSQSLNAAVVEECLFRAIPIASALMIGKYYKKPWLFLILALPLQAIIFGIAHASYPQQPFYIRTVEMFLPFMIYGIVYFYHGLIPCIISHYLYDVYQFSGPIFNMTSQGIWLQKTACILCLLLPALIVLRAIILHPQGLTQKLPEKFLNAAWKPLSQKQKQPTQSFDSSTFLSTKNLMLATCIGLLSLATLYQVWQSIPILTPPLQISKIDAQKKALEIAKTQNINPTDKWQQTQIATLSSNSSVHYLTEKLGEESTRNLLKNKILKSDNGSLNLESFFPHYAWQIRFARFEGTQSEKSNELIVEIGNNSTIFIHKVSETEIIPSLDETQANALALSHLKKNFPNATFSKIKTASTITDKKRTDWKFTFEFQGPKKLHIVQPRVDINIIGNSIASEERYLFVPEKWLINLQKMAGETSPIYYTLSFGILVICIIILATACQAFLHATDRRVFKITCVGIASLFLIHNINNWPTLTHGFTTAIEYQNQLTMVLSGQIILMLFALLQIAVIMFFCTVKQNRLAQSQQLWQTMLAGILLGFGPLAITASINAYIAPIYNWYYAPIMELSSFVPALTPFFTLITVLCKILIMISISLLLREQRSSIIYYLISILAWTIVITLLSLGTDMNSPFLLTVYKILGCLVYTVIIWPIIQRQPLSIVMFIIALDVGTGTIHLGTPSYPSAWSMHVFSSTVKLVCGMGLSWYWYTLQKTEHPQTT